MAILIQQQTGAINIIDTALVLGEQIKLSLRLDSVASPFSRTGDPDYIQTYDSNGVPAYKIVLDGTLQYQDEGGAPATWGGTLDELNNKLNNEYFVQASGGGGGGGNVVVTNNTDPSTATKQDQQTANLATSNTNEALALIELEAIKTELEDQGSAIVDLEDNTKRKSVGKLIELANDNGGNWQGFPVEATEVILSINGVQTSYPMNSVQSLTNDSLAQQLNSVQNVVFFDFVRNSDELTFNGVNVSNSEVTGVIIEDTNAGTLEYDSFNNSTDEDTGASQQSTILLQQQLAVMKELLSKKQELEPAISLSYAGTLPVNLTIDLDLNGNTIPVNRFGDVTIFALNNDVEYRLDGGVVFLPAKTYPRTKKDQVTYLKNVNLNLFILAGAAGNSRQSVVVSLYKI